MLHEKVLGLTLTSSVESSINLHIFKCFFPNSKEICRIFFQQFRIDRNLTSEMEFEFTGTNFSNCLPFLSRTEIEPFSKVEETTGSSG